MGLQLSFNLNYLHTFVTCSIFYRVQIIIGSCNSTEYFRESRKKRGGVPQKVGSLEVPAHLNKVAYQVLFLKCVLKCVQR